MAVDADAAHVRVRRPSGAPRGSAAGSRRWLTHGAPYLLLFPTLVVVGAVLGYPLYRLVDISLRHYGFAQAINPDLPAPLNGLANYTKLFHDHFFYSVLLRTVAWAAAVVAATMVVGVLLALLMERISKPMRLALTFTLICVWSMPRVVATEMWKWLTSYDFGVLNYVLAHLGLHRFDHYNWFVPSRPVPGFVLLGIVVLWGALPFVVITVYATLTQVPKELIEAARVDGASAPTIFRNVTFPILRPMLVILTSLSVIWDFGVFDQFYVMLDNVPDKAFWVMGLYAYQEAFRQGSYGFGAAISLVIVAILLVIAVFYMRQMVRLGETE